MIGICVGNILTGGAGLRVVDRPIRPGAEDTRTSFPPTQGLETGVGRIARSPAIPATGVGRSEVGCHRETTGRPCGTRRFSPSHACPIIGFECPASRYKPDTKIGFPSFTGTPILWRRPLIATGGLATTLAGFVFAIAACKAPVAVLDAAPLATVSTTVVAVYDTAKCSVPLIAMVEFENVPVMLAAFSTVKVWPIVGVKELIYPTVNVPPRLAVPVICSWLYFVPTVVPPMETFMVPEDNCV